MEGSFCLQINKSLLCLQKSLTFSHASAWTLTRWVVNNQRKRLLVISLFQVTHLLAALKRADHASKHTLTHTLTGKTTTNVLTAWSLWGEPEQAADCWFMAHRPHTMSNSVCQPEQLHVHGLRFKLKSWVESLPWMSIVHAWHFSSINYHVWLLKASLHGLPWYTEFR